MLQKNNARNALVKNDDGTISYGGVTLTRTGVSFDSELRESEWIDLVAFIKTVEDSVAWWLGDLFAYCEKKNYGDMTELAVAFGYDVKTIWNYKWVAQYVETSLRNEHLSFNHHYQVATMNPGDQQYWLRQADENGWSVSQLRRAIKEANQIETDDEILGEDEAEEAVIVGQVSQSFQLVRQRYESLEPSERGLFITLLRQWLEEIG